MSARRKAHKLQPKNTGVKSYSNFISNVFQQVYPDELTKNEGTILRCPVMSAIFEHVATEARKLAKYNKKDYLTDRDLKIAIHFILPGDITKYVITEDKYYLQYEM
jgi:histone H2B